MKKSTWVGPNAGSHISIGITSICNEYGYKWTMFELDLRVKNISFSFQGVQGLLRDAYFNPSVFKFNFAINVAHLKSNQNIVNIS